MKCPGQDMQYWKSDAIFDVKCPECGENVEFFKDDTARKCDHCGHRFANPRMDFGCAAYCKYAEHCIGTLPPELLAQKNDLLKDRVAIEMKKHFKRDFKKIGRATRVARHAETIGKTEGANLAVILTAAYLHQVDSDATPSDTAVARGILESLGAQEPLVEEVSEIILRRRRADAGDSLEIRIMHDAEEIESLSEQQTDGDAGSELERMIDAAFLTEAGKKQARSVLLGK